MKSASLPVPVWVLAAVAIGVALAVVVMRSGPDEVVVPGKPAVFENEAAKVPLPSGDRGGAGDNVRAWIKSLTLQPAFPNRDQTVAALLEWEPQGRSGMAVSYEWFVNEVSVETGQTGELVLGKYHPGDRVNVTATIIGPDGKPLASDRSRRPIVIQNRPPALEGGLEEFQKTDKELIGHIRSSDPDGDKVTVKLVSGPAGLTVQPDGTVLWPVAHIQLGKHELTVELEDERGLGFRGTLPFSIEAQE